MLLTYYYFLSFFDFCQGVLVEVNIVIFCFGAAVAYLVAVGDSPYSFDMRVYSRILNFKISYPL